MSQNHQGNQVILGLHGYYRKFIKDFAKITKPITRQLKGKKSIVIDDEFRRAVETSKNLLCNDSILIYPDFTKPFTLTTDASNYAIGSVLSQGLTPTTNPYLSLVEPCQTQRSDISL